MILPAKIHPAPPIQEAPDEGWWQSVLAEEEHHLPRRISRSQVDAPVSAANPDPEPAALDVDWEQAQSLYRQDQIVTLSVSGHNRGGLLVQNATLQGFVPYSHLVDMTCQTDAQRELFLSSFEGKDLALKIIECVPEESRIVFSERAARAEAGSRTQIFSDLRPGEVVSGEVTNITDFGVFIDLGGVEGLIHISELSWGRVLHPAHILKLGETVRVQVLDILPERCRIALSLKRLQPNPWQNAASRYAVNDIVPATITSVVSFGVFARLEEGLEGLVHISEMDLGKASVRETYAEGQKLNVRILHIDPHHQRLGLSLKALG